MKKQLLFILELFFLFLTGFSSLLFFIPTITKIIVDVQLVFYIIILFLNYKRNNAFNLYQIWIAAYVFMVWSEMEIIAVNSFSDNYIIPFVRFTLANFSFLLGYHFYKNKDFNINRIQQVSTGNGMFLFVLILLYVYFIVTKFVAAQNIFYNGRSYGSGSAIGNGTLLGSLTSALGLLLPAIIGYYITVVKRKSILISVLLSLPIFIILLLTTSRYKFLFSVLPFLIVTGIFDLNSPSFKKNLLLFLSMLLIIALTGYLKKHRNIAFVEFEASELFVSQSKGQDVFENLAYQMSPETVVYMASVADDYFSTHDLHYGKETGFLFIFWVPRGWWPDKPTMLDNWLIREYENVGEGFSSASGFIGELRADFGWFCLLFMFLFGLLIHRFDDYTRFVLNTKPSSYNLVLIAILYPWVFFAVRSPITATMSLLWELLVWRVLLITFTKVKNSNYYAISFSD